MTVVVDRGGPRPSSRSEAPRWRGLRPGLRERLVSPMPTDRLTGWVWTLLVTLLAAYVRFNRLGVPGKPVFDELYYAHDSDSLINHGAELGKSFAPDDPSFVVHPPLGKWMIGAGMWLHDDLLGQGRSEPLVYKDTVFHYTSAGWRFSSAIVGTLAVLILIRVVRRMTRSTLLGCIAGLLMAFEGLELVQSRISMLDIFLMFWVLAAFACLVADRDWGRRRLADRLEDAGTAFTPDPPIGFRPWRLGMALCLGAACATKWNGLFFVVLFALLAFAWDIGARRTGGSQTPVVAALRRDALPLVLVVAIAVPVIYTLSWGGWFLTDNGFDRQWAADPHNRSEWNIKAPLLGFTILHVPDAWSNAMPDVVRSWVHYQWQIWNFHDNLKSRHPYQSHPLGWLFLARPASYFYSSSQNGSLGCTSTGGCSKEVIGLGTPAIWWTSIAALAACVWFWVSRRDWRAGAAVLGVAFAILPWVPADTLDQRTMFSFYALPAVPFMIIAITICIGYVLGPPTASLLRRQWGATIVGIYLVLVVVNFFYIYPILTAQVIPSSDWNARIWFGSWV